MPGFPAKFTSFFNKGKSAMGDALTGAEVTATELIAESHFCRSEENGNAKALGFL